MKNYLKTSILVLILGISQTTSFSQPANDWQLTQQFLGLWSGPTVLNLGGTPFNIIYNTDFQPSAEGSAIAMNEWFDDPALGGFRGANLIGQSAADGMIHWFSVDNFGTAHDHTGSWVNPRHFYMVHESQVDGQTFREDIHFRLRANNTRMLASLVATMDGVVVQTIDGVLYLQGNGNRSANVDQSSNTIEVYPNPSHGKFTIESSEDIRELFVYNQFGQEMIHVNPDSMEYDLQLNETGVFILKIQTSTGIETKKIVIE